jgi:hypothetical protein
MQTINAITIPTTIPVSVPNHEISRLAQNLIRSKFDWKEDYSIVNGNLVNRESVHTSHSFVNETHIRIANEQDYEVQTTLKILQKIC